MPVRLKAVVALGKIGGERALERLVDALRNDELLVRSAAAAGLSRNEWKPRDRIQKIRYLVAVKKWDQAAKVAPTAVPSGDNGCEGSFALDTPILVRLSVNTLHVLWIEFGKGSDQLQAILHLRYPLGPKACWRIEVDLLDSEKKVLGHKETLLENSRIMKGVAVVGEKDLTIVLGEWSQFSEAARFAVNITSVAPGKPIADQGAVIVKRSGEQFCYKKKCEACGYTAQKEMWSHFPAPGGTAVAYQPEFTYPKCGNRREVVINGE